MKLKLIMFIAALMVILSLEVTAYDFTDNEDGTVTDNIRGFMWQQEDDDVQRNWEVSITYCEGLSLADHDDWRLPNYKELSSIVDYNEFNPAIDDTYFLNTNSSYYLSSTPSVGYPSLTWYVNFYDGYVDYYQESNGEYFVRCVRGGQ